MFRIDYKSGLPIYEQIYRQILKMGAMGIYSQDNKLPSVRAVAQDLGINPNTVQKAYGLLERDGAIVSLPGKGSFFTGDQTLSGLQKKDALKKIWQASQEAADCGLSRDEITDAAIRGFERRVLE